jgi:chromosome segregation ATPase
VEQAQSLSTEVKQTANLIQPKTQQTKQVDEKKNSITNVRRQVQPIDTKVKQQVDDHQSEEAIRLAIEHLNNDIDFHIKRVNTKRLEIEKAAQELKNAEDDLKKCKGELYNMKNDFDDLEVDKLTQQLKQIKSKRSQVVKHIEGLKLSIL